MDMAGVEKDLERRINQSREWLQSGEIALISGLKIRKYPCQIEPVKFLDRPGKKTRYGIRFRLEFITERGTFESFVEVRIQPTRSMSKDGESIANPPYIDTYAFCQETQKDAEIMWENLQNTKIYEGTVNLSIQEWYIIWLRKTLFHKNVSKIFGFKKEKR